MVVLHTKNVLCWYGMRDTRNQLESSANVPTSVVFVYRTVICIAPSWIVTSNLEGSVLCAVNSRSYEKEQQLIIIYWTLYVLMDSITNYYCPILLCETVSGTT
jgi:hypothetical protein